MRPHRKLIHIKHIFLFSLTGVGGAGAYPSVQKAHKHTGLVACAGLTHSQTDTFTSRKITIHLNCESESEQTQHMQITLMQNETQDLVLGEQC